jgi:ATP phosphoribosyltransferase
MARRLRLPRYRIFPVAGAAEAYPPEDADLALIPALGAQAVQDFGLRPLFEVMRSSACVIANRRSLASKDLTPLAPLLFAGSARSSSLLTVPDGVALTQAPPRWPERIRLALPDGHARSHTAAALLAAGITVSGYESDPPPRRPAVDFESLEVKVIRPQDMPQQVAIGNFDLAVTGRDVLFDHRLQFPSSPVKEIIDLGRSRYGLAAIVKDVEADTLVGALAEWRRRGDRPVRIASEYPNIADHFARERHVGRYSVIPIAGASEGFVPEDADILIEGIDTGSSVRANNLTVLERFFESTNCVIAHKRPPEGALRATFDAVVERLRAGVLAPVAAGRG